MHAHTEQQSDCELLLLFAPCDEEGKPPPSLGEVKYGGKSKRVLRADRTVGNYLEQSPPFLVALWVGAVVYGEGEPREGGTQI